MRKKACSRGDFHAVKYLARYSDTVFGTILASACVLFMKKSLNPMLQTLYTRASYSKTNHAKFHDSMVGDFIRENPKGTVVNIACGMDTRVYLLPFSDLLDASCGMGVMPGMFRNDCPDKNYTGIDLSENNCDVGIIRGKKRFQIALCGPEGRLRY